LGGDVGDEVVDEVDYGVFVECEYFGCEFGGYVFVEVFVE